jgi:predicted benzoate:H+ symporter BenE
VAVAAAGLALLRRAGTTVYGGPLRLAHAPARRRHVYGAAIFGAGFGLTGASPGGAVAMVAAMPPSWPLLPAGIAMLGEGLVALAGWVGHSYSRQTSPSPPWVS